MTEIASPAAFTGRPSVRPSSSGARRDDAAAMESGPPFALADGEEDAGASEAAAADMAPVPADAALSGRVLFPPAGPLVREDEIEAEPTADAAVHAPSTTSVAVDAPSPAGVAFATAPPARPETGVPDQTASSTASAIRTDDEAIRIQTAIRAAPGRADGEAVAQGARMPPPPGPAKPELPGSAEPRARSVLPPSAPVTDASEPAPRGSPDPALSAAPSPATRADRIDMIAARPVTDDAGIALGRVPIAGRGPLGRTPEAPPVEAKAELPQLPAREAALPAPVATAQVAAGAAGVNFVRMDPGATQAPPSLEQAAALAEPALSRRSGDRAAVVETTSAPGAPAAAPVAMTLADPRRMVGARSPSAAELGVRMAAAAAAGDEAQAASSADGGDLGPLASGLISTPGGGGVASVVMPPPHPGGPELARAVGDQLSVALSRRGRGVVELRLDPPELGRVRLTLGRGEHGVTAAIVADRPDVADLLRRHADVLSQALTDAGHPRAELRFGAGAWSGAGGAGADGKGSGGNGAGAGRPVEDAAPQFAHASQPRGPFGPRDGLDLRV